MNGFLLDTNVLVERLPLPYDAGRLAAQAFLKYRRAGGTKNSPLPDFYIGGQAEAEGLTLNAAYFVAARRKPSGITVGKPGGLRRSANKNAPNGPKVSGIGLTRWPATNERRRNGTKLDIALASQKRTIRRESPI